MSNIGKSELHSVLSSILKERAYTRVNGQKTSERTISAYTEVLGMCFDKLHELGYKIQNPRNLNEDHVRALCQHWHENGKAVSTIQEYISKLRVFGGWIGKKGMVKSLHTYLPHVDKELLNVKKTAIKSKSWTGNGIDVAQKIQQADALDERFGLMIRMMLAFGLRRKEVIHHRPHVADHHHKLVIFAGEAKNGRPRDIMIETVEQRQVLDYVKNRIKKSEHLGWKETVRGKSADFEYSLKRYSDLMAKIGITKYEQGVTGHGLRAQFAENAALIAGLIPPTLGGTQGQKPKEDINVTRAQVSQALGHVRVTITNSYYGSFGRHVKQDIVDRCQFNINKALHTVNDLLPVPDERIPDCLQLIRELNGINVDATPKQVHRLWKTHSNRFAREWIALRAGNIEALEAAAKHIVK